MDAKEDIEENIDIEGQIECKEMLPKVKSSKSKSSTCHSEGDTTYSVNEEYSRSNFLTNLNQSIIFHDQDLNRKAFSLNNNLWECELEMKI